MCSLELGPELRIEPISAADPAALIGNVYERVSRDPARLAGQLDLLADLAATARFIRVTRGGAATPRELVTRLLQTLSSG